MVEGTEGDFADRFVLWFRTIERDGFGFAFEGSRRQDVELDAVAGGFTNELLSGHATRPCHCGPLDQ